jgi:hypothetical protein
MAKVIGVNLTKFIIFFSFVGFFFEKYNSILIDFKIKL